MPNRQNARNIIRLASWIVLGLLVAAYLYFSFSVETGKGILVGLLITLFLSKLPWRKSWQEMIVAGLALFVIADITYNFSAPTGIYDPANMPSRLVIALWILGYCSILLAAIYKLTDPETRYTRVAAYVDSQTEA